jgi:hypothetical protein
VKALLHGAAWLPLVVGLFGSIAGKWTATGDNAVISIRSWEQLSKHGTLVGQPTFISHVFDLGPMEYWLLALPVHIDPRYGPLIGATLACMVAVSLAVEAAWSAFGPPGGVLAVAFVTGVVAWVPVVSYQSTWNPHFGEFWYLATIASAVAVLMGDPRWFAAVVVCGSIASQAHLMFGLPSVGLAVLAGLLVAVEAAKRRTSWQWLFAGVVVGVGCWIAPVIQQFTGHPGNMVQFVKSQGHVARMGLRYGLQALAASVDPRILRPGGSNAIGQPFLSHASVLGGVAILAATVVVVLLGVMQRAQLLIAIGCVALILSLGLVAVYANTPRSSVKVSTYYLIEPIFVVGALCIVTFCVAAWFCVRRLWGQVREPGGAPAAPAVVVGATDGLGGDVSWPGGVEAPGWPGLRVSGVSGTPTAESGVEAPQTPRPERSPRMPADQLPAWSARRRLAAFVATIVLLATSAAAIDQLVPAYGNRVLAQHQLAVPRACALIDNQLKPGPVALDVTARNSSQEQLFSFAIAWCLLPDGYSPELPARLAAYLGPTFSISKGAPVASVVISGTSAKVSISSPGRAPAT